MRRRWFWVVIIIIALLLLLGFLYSKGLIHVKWQFLTMILAGLAGPFKFVADKFSKTNRTLNNMTSAHDNRINAAHDHRLAYDQAILEREEKIQNLETQVNILEQKIDDLEVSKQQIQTQVNDMSDDDLQDAFLNMYDDEN